MKKYIIIFICLAALFQTNVYAIMPQVSARSAVVIDADSCAVVAEKDARRRLPMASTTKIMTALVALENASFDDVITVSEKAVGVEGSSVCLKAGEKLTLEQLLYAMLLESANDAAAAIAIGVGGSIEGFAEMMNQKAQSLGLTDTSFTNPHGLDGENHFTTALDLAKITAAAMENEKFAQIVSTYRYNIPNSDQGKRYLMNHNKLLKLYDGAVGVKTGFTKKSGRCLVSCAKRDGMTFIAVTLGAPDDWNDHITMLDAAFASHERKILIAENEIDIDLSCVGGSEKVLNVKNETELSATLPKDADGISKMLYLPRFVYAPIKEGDVIGRLVVRTDGKIIGESKITAQNNSDMISEKKPFWDIF